MRTLNLIALVMLICGALATTAPQAPETAPLICFVGATIVNAIRIAVREIKR